MADKKKSFANPFSALKGFVVSAEESTAKPAAKKQAPPPQAPKKPHRSQAEVEDADLFAAEMAALGFAPEKKQEEPQSATPPGPAGEIPPEEQQLFLDSIQALDPHFRDSIPAPASEHVPAAPRLERLLRRNKLIPEEQIDLHGLGAEEAKTKVATFIDYAGQRGVESVLIITGQGFNSSDGPVLRPLIESWLRGPGAKLVGQWTVAPRHLGGEGALVVLLKKRQAP